ncbi:MAG: AraC family transcriptional regulator, partial [Cyanophyceae cyanobacterium]
MAIEITELEIDEWRAEAEGRGEQVFQQSVLGDHYLLPKDIGQGGDRVIQLRGGLTLAICETQFFQPMQIKRSHEESFPLTAKFYLAGASTVTTQNTAELASEYSETAGSSYLYHLPDLTEIETWSAHKPNQMVMIYADVDYFRTLNPTTEALPQPLQALMQDTGRFHQSAGKM